jgi:hypothetical protein
MKALINEIMAMKGKMKASAWPINESVIGSVMKSRNDLKLIERRNSNVALRRHRKRSAKRRQR